MIKGKNLMSGSAWMRGIKNYLSDYRMLIYAIILIIMMLVNNNENLNYYKEKLFSGFKTKDSAGRNSKKGKEGVS